ncbi:hypothetical protein CDQ84_14010 [Clostridium thermosuccinogenes]|uniref:Uncharacterized protein n=1 Tax=Clostridium thermosuccinogenes TaxID=84032 RepID=A0A2K2FE40_9CLOT|nr:hypothetical protein CDO33_04685 [Pseudoclostridium thermosuccinogenes]PNT95751.1 hypothetical protein CDQ85_13880 [Pseudoclostridium thermosuccinogenes]PNT97035.1 hypothetical protein CDQ84_14010 [Pseudoclostridium thermosuccinogenes]
MLSAQYNNLQIMHSCIELFSDIGNKKTEENVWPHSPFVFYIDRELMIFYDMILYDTDIISEYLTIKAWLYR